MKHFFLLIFLFSFCSCHKYPIEVRIALEQAGENRPQLEFVLNKYYWGDRYKYRAACFLIANMPYH